MNEDLERPVAPDAPFEDEDLAEIREVAGPDCLQEKIDAGWPPALIKASYDTFTYMAGLAGGLVVEFEYCSEAETEGWVVLESPKIVGLEMPGFVRGGLPKVNFERGMEVRLGAIIWVVDAPYGS